MTGTGQGRGLDHVVLAVRSLDAAAAVYEGLGFTLTPRARHEDRMGTSNRLVQFEGRTFIELLEVDRPDTLVAHDFGAAPPQFSFGAACRNGVTHREGIALLVFRTDDTRADIAAFATNGLQTYAPFDFERQARLPDGSAVTVSFSLGFATAPEMPRAPIFVCENRAQEHFWKPAFQTHANGATTMRAVYLSTPDPKRDAPFFGRLFGGRINAIDGGFSIACSDGAVRVLSPEAIAEIDDSVPLSPEPVFAGIAVSGPTRPMVPASAGGGMFIVVE